MMKMTCADTQYRTCTTLKVEAHNSSTVETPSGDMISIQQVIE